MKRLFALVGLSALTATPVMAEDSSYWDTGRDDRGFYVGADLGQYNWSLDENALNQSVADTLGDLGLTVIDGASETSEDGFTWGLILGYQLLPFLAFEAAYVDLGSAEYKSNVNVTDGTNTSGASALLNVDSTGAAVSALGILPFARNWQVFGRAGAYFGSTDSTGRLSGAAIEPGVSDSSNATSFLWGAGLGYSNGQWTSRLEYQQFTDVGDDGSFSGVDVDRIVFSAVYRTGFGAWHGRPAAVAVPVAAAAPVAAVAPAPADSDGDGVIDANDRCPNTPPGDRVGPFGCSCDVSVQVHFAFDSAELTPEDRAVLDGVAARLNELQFIGGEVAGHTDSTGDRSHNLDLSKRRAQSVLDYLEARGVAPGRMTSVGYGPDHPVADNSTAEGRALNRRVVIRRTDCGPAY